MAGADLSVLSQIVQHKRVYIDSRGWKAVAFERAFPYPPTVIPVAEVRGGWYRPSALVPPTVDIPEAVQLASVDIPSITIPDVSIILPSMDRPNLRDAFYDAVVAKVDSIEFPFPINFLANFFARTLIGPIAGLIGWLLDGFVETAIWGKIRALRNNVQSSINTLKNAIRNNIQSTMNTIEANIEGALNGAIDQINMRVATFRDNVQGGLTTVTGYAANAVNQSIDTIWGMLGLEQGMLFTPIAIKNITAEGFEIYAPSPMNLLYIAIGMPATTPPPIPPEPIPSIIPTLPELISKLPQIQVAFGDRTKKRTSVW